MKAEDGFVELGECPKCAALVFQGRSSGVLVRLSERKLPARGACYLALYAVPVYRVEKLASGRLLFESWTPGLVPGLMIPDRGWLVREHVCTVWK